MIRKSLLVTGSPRSGTHAYHQHLVWTQQWRLEHERMGEQGTVSSVFCVDDDDYNGGHHGDGRFSDYEFEIRIHLLRHPAGVIPSLRWQMPKTFWAWQEKHTGLAIRQEDPWQRPTDEQAARFWLAWTELADAVSSYRIRVEDLPHLPRVVSGPPRHPCRPPIDEWNDLCLEPSTRRRVRRRLRQYGYE